MHLYGHIASGPLCVDQANAARVRMQEAAIALGCRAPAGEVVRRWFWNRGSRSHVRTEVVQIWKKVEERKGGKKK